MFDPAGFSEFSYEGYSFDSTGETFRAFYSLLGQAGSIEFVETIRLPNGNQGRPAGVPSARTARLLALASGLSYYKAAAPGTVRVGFGLTDGEHTFLSELIRNGLGEFAFRNQLPGALTPQITGKRLDEVPDEITGAVGGGAAGGGSGARGGGEAGGAVAAAPAAPLVPVGGGKDSVVTIESLKAAGFDPVLFSVNTFAPITRCARVSGQPLVSAQRSIDPALLEANRQGAHNGHVPVTAVVSLIALMAAERLGLGPVVMSNERSAEYGNLSWNGHTINHQWSKSIHFEALLRSALESSGGAASGGTGADAYFSLLRPLSELEIARRFAGLPAYFEAFTSCNRSFRIDESKRASSWCRECPKCQFVFLVLAPFLSSGRLTEIFGGNMLDDPANLDGYLEILGLRGHKPFECVGEYDEALVALALLGRDPGWVQARLVGPLTDEMHAKGQTPAPGLDAALLEPSATHFIPRPFREALDALG
ncbi:hypothetical protein Ga0074812_110122 [Parafrankia irregularis]|uniref:UDP-N-acetyl-alpha-D-muramoyl-L-alanyl-L-glutamate epimerase n=1 Tax=Parafrankia irregularis TaxID=795642 RepID=A0A0S4QNT4_9ACTN|nr:MULTISPECIES: hypothetical protein [Parafrankia]MBE3206013.1 hypothetical protein [Parafrankia sp. CH37]CUU57107.1 hypothetical protein Ga0074812_110122 [Parafrankia irregularis]